MDVGTRGSGSAVPTVEAPQADSHLPTTDRPTASSGATSTAKAQRGIPKKILFPTLALTLILAAAFGYRTWYNSVHFVYTENAQVSGAIIPVGATSAGQVSAVLTDVGQHVTSGQVVARVTVPQTLAVTSSGTPRVGFANTANQMVEVTTPISGVVVSRSAHPGSTVGPGQPVIAVVDPTKLYVTAYITETDLNRIRVGQAVDVTVDSLRTTLPGRIQAITPASAASFSLIPAQNASGNFTKVSQVIPVKIALEYGSLPLVIGSSVEVNIHVG